MYKTPEKRLHKAICDYLKYNHKGIIFNTDLSGIKLTKGQAKGIKALRSNKGFPDLVIYEKRGNYGALFLELKAEGKSPFKKNGELKKDEHLESQYKKILRLREAGYCAKFATGFEKAIRIINEYLNLKK